MKTRSKTGTLLKTQKLYSYTNEIKDQDSNEHKETKSRFRKNDDQVKILIQEFNKNPYWGKKLVLELSAKTDLSESQVYKWNWDYRKKIRKSEKKSQDSKFSCKETILPSRFEADLINLQKVYKSSFNSVPFATPSRFLFSGSI